MWFMGGGGEWFKRGWSYRRESTGSMTLPLVQEEAAVHVCRGVLLPLLSKLVADGCFNIGNVVPVCLVVGIAELQQGNQNKSQAKVKR